MKVQINIVGVGVIIATSVKLLGRLADAYTEEEQAEDGFDCKSASDYVEKCSNYINPYVLISSVSKEVSFAGTYFLKSNVIAICDVPEQENDTTAHH